MAYLYSVAIAYVNCSFNNTHVSITTIKGQILATGSGGTLGFKGHKRSTSHASLSVAKLIALKSYKKGVRNLYVKLKGFGNGRKACLRGLILSGKINILDIKDITAVPYNGCKSSKQRRI
jgi:small subunit ribosomal protein S11